MAPHHFPAYAIDLSVDVHVWKDETESSRPLRLHKAYSSGFQPVGHRRILWWATELFESEMETGRVDWLVGLPVGSRFFDRPVKPFEKPVEFSFLATKRHLSTNRNILKYFIINKTFYKKLAWTSHTFSKDLLNRFKLWLICCDH